VASRKKLIEVALPLEAINKASAREKSIRHGHPSTLHLWWARRPLASARAVIFAQMVDDPSSLPDLFPTEKKQQEERERLFRIIEDLVHWENTNNEEVLERARAEIRQSWRRACDDNAGHPRAKELFDRYRLPGFHDPFAGGGALPLEAQRLGLEACAGDLNPVAVLINKAMIEIPPRFAGRPPVNPDHRPIDGLHPKAARADPAFSSRDWKGARGLAEDVWYYGKWMRDEAEKRIGHLYPKISVTEEVARDRPDLRPYIGKRLTVIAWIWARTVRSPNPAFANVPVPLASTFMLSTRAGKEAYVEPVIERDGYRFTVNVGKPYHPDRARKGTKLSRGPNFRCVMSDTPIDGGYIKAEGKARRMGARLMAIVAEGDRGRVYLAPTPEHETVATKATPWWEPEGDVPSRLTGGTCVPYGLATWASLFTPRQLVALTTFSDLVGEAIRRVRGDALAAGLVNDGRSLRDGGTGAAAYAEAVGVYLGCLPDQQANQSSTICGWNNINQQMIAAFSRQAIPMVWDYAECNVFSQSTGSLWNLLERQVKGISALCGSTAAGAARQADATQQSDSAGRVVSTDPPYYDNIGYADLSDFFYRWLRRSLRDVFPELFATVAVPKIEELVAMPHRHGSKEKAETFFLDGMTKAMHRLVKHAHPAFPVTVYYASKQSENAKGGGRTSTGWETFLDAVIRAGFSVSGTWPVKTESANKLKANVAALASSIILVCRPRAADAPSGTRREFAAALRDELPAALRRLQEGNIAPVDLAQASIGPGMAIYTRYSKVLDTRGRPVPVRDALALINQVLGETLAEQEGDFDPDTRFALAWFEQHGFAEGEFGLAETLSKAKNTSVSALVQGGILESKRGKVRLLRPSELCENWDPAGKRRLAAWETVHHLVRALESGGEGAAAELVQKLGGEAEVVCELAYRLYSLCERKKRAAEAVAYNGLVHSFPEVIRLAREGERLDQP